MKQLKLYFHNQRNVLSIYQINIKKTICSENHVKKVPFGSASKKLKDNNFVIEIIHSNNFFILINDSE